VLPKSNRGLSNYREGITGVENGSQQMAPLSEGRAVYYQNGPSEKFLREQEFTTQLRVNQTLGPELHNPLEEGGRESRSRCPIQETKREGVP
jgi:hypothetical protein